jgi:hypothetical protein
MVADFLVTPIGRLKGREIHHDHATAQLLVGVGQEGLSEHARERGAGRIVCESIQLTPLSP